MDDRDAIRLCRAGDSDAFRHLVIRYQTEAIGHARAILGSVDDAADATQEAFIAAFRALGRFDEERRFYPWFYTILRNRCFKILEQRTSRQPVCLEEVELLAATGRLSPEDLIALEAALIDLGPEDREILTLRHFDGMSYAELADLIGIPTGTVMSRLYNARKRLRERLGPATPLQEEKRQ